MASSISIRCSACRDCPTQKRGRSRVLKLLLDQAQHLLDIGLGVEVRQVRAYTSPLLHAPAPGAGYDAHVDAYDVAILVLSGTVEPLGRRVERNGVIFYAAGEPHCMKNIGETQATYLVFEFHGPPTDPDAPGLRERLGRRIPDPMKRVLRKLRSMVRRG